MFRVVGGVREKITICEAVLNIMTSNLVAPNVEAVCNDMSMDETHCWSLCGFEVVCSTMCSPDMTSLIMFSLEDIGVVMASSILVMSARCCDKRVGFTGKCGDVNCLGIQ